MSIVLAQLAVIIGGVIAVIAFFINILRQNEWLVAAYRSGVVFFVSVIIFLFFFRVFSMVLSRFVAEQVMKQKQAEKKTGDEQK